MQCTRRRCRHCCSHRRPEWQCRSFTVRNAIKQIFDRSACDGPLRIIPLDIGHNQLWPISIELMCANQRLLAQLLLPDKFAAPKMAKLCHNAVLVMTARAPETVARTHTHICEKCIFPLESAMRRQPSDPSRDRVIIVCSSSVQWYRFTVNKTTRTHRPGQFRVDVYGPITVRFICAVVHAVLRCHHH